MRVIDECHEVAVVLSLSIITSHELDLARLLFALVRKLLDDTTLLEIVLEEAVEPAAVVSLLAEVVVTLVLALGGRENVPVLVTHVVGVDHQEVTRLLGHKWLDGVLTSRHIEPDFMQGASLLSIVVERVLLLEVEEAAELFDHGTMKYDNLLAVLDNLVTI